MSSRLKNGSNAKYFILLLLSAQANRFLLKCLKNYKFTEHFISILENRERMYARIGLRKLLSSLFVCLSQKGLFLTPLLQVFVDIVPCQ